MSEYAKREAINRLQADVVTLQSQIAALLLIIVSGKLNVPDTLNGKTYVITTENGVVTPVEV